MTCGGTPSAQAHPRVRRLLELEEAPDADRRRIRHSPAADHLRLPGCVQRAVPAGPDRPGGPDAAAPLAGTNATERPPAFAVDASTWARCDPECSPGGVLLLAVAALGRAT